MSPNGAKTKPESTSTSVGVDDGAVSRCSPPRCDPTKAVSAPLSRGTTSSLPLPSHSPSLGVPLVVPSSPLSVNPHEETRDGLPSHSGPVRQREDALPGLMPSLLQNTSRKRKHTDGALRLHPEGDDASTTGAGPQSPRSTRPRLRARRDREFSPLLIMSPEQRQELVVAEETIEALHYPPHTTDRPSSIQRYFHHGNSRGYGPRILQNSALPQVSESPVSVGSASLAKDAPTTAVSPKHGRLSTLQDLDLPRPFEETEKQKQSLGGVVVVHERGLEAGPSFLFAKGRPSDAPSASREPAGSSRPAMPSLEAGLEFFGGPVCNSPDSLDSGGSEAGPKRHETPTV